MEEVQQAPQAPQSPATWEFKWDKKYIPATVALAIIIALLGGYLYLKFIYGDGHGCLKMLPFPECFSGKTIEYQGDPAVGYNLPAGVEIKAPFFVAYFDDNPEGEPRPIWMTLGVPETSSFVDIASYYLPAVEPGTGVEAGELIATTAEPGEYFEEASQSTFIIRVQDLELGELYRY